MRYAVYRLMTLLGSAALLVGTVLPVSALGAAPGDSAIAPAAPPLRVTGGTEGKDYLFDADTATLTVLQGDLTVAGTGSAREKGSIVVFRDYTGTLTLDSVTLQGADGAALMLQPDSQATLVLQGDNLLQGTENYAGVYAPAGAELTITGTGSLTAVGGTGGAGIGGCARSVTPADPGLIRVQSGTVTARGGNAARAENTGSLESNGTLELDDSTLANAADAAMDGTGTVILGRSGRMEGPEPVEMRTEYRVRFASGEGATVAEETIVTREGKLPALPQAEREGYALDGWFTAPEGGTRVDEKTAITGSQTLYARWSPTGAPVATPTPAPTATPTPAPAATATPAPAATPTPAPAATPTPAPAATSTPKPTPAGDAYAAFQHDGRPAPGGGALWSGGSGGIVALHPGPGRIPLRGLVQR